MQTFFSDGGDLSKPKLPRFWLIAPFSLEALAFVFGNSKENSSRAELVEKAKAYIDKTFSLAFFVPPPILANWRRYLWQQLKRAFPEHDDSDLRAIQVLFDISKSSSQPGSSTTLGKVNSITPREIKLFVNSIVVLFRQRGSELSLPIVASYVLHRDEILASGFNNDPLSAMEREIVNVADGRPPLAALHFGVPLQEADQLLLQEPIVAALRLGNGADLLLQEKRHGFVDVLQKVVREELDQPQGPQGVVLAKIAVAINALEGAKSPELLGLWREMRQRLERTDDWEGFLQSIAAQGIDAVLAHTPSLELDRICRSVAKAVAKATVGDPPQGPGPFGYVTNWVNSALAVSKGIGPEPWDGIVISGGYPFQLEVIQQLAGLGPDRGPTQIFKFAANPDGLTDLIASQINGGRPIRHPERFVEFVVEEFQLSLVWPKLEQAANTRLRGSVTSNLERMSAADHAIGCFLGNWGIPTCAGCFERTLAIGLFVILAVPQQE